MAAASLWRRLRCRFSVAGRRCNNLVSACIALIAHKVHTWISWQLAVSAEQLMHCLGGLGLDCTQMWQTRLYGRLSGDVFTVANSGFLLATIRTVAAVASN
eukprot:6184265-Pleurochrysis_carterae.AAC.4